MQVTLYSWCQKDPRTERWRTLRWKMTDESAAEHARAYGVELERVEGSEEVRTDLSGKGAAFFPAHCTAAIEKYFDDLQAGSEPCRPHPKQTTR